MKIDPTKLDPVLRGYIIAALWTSLNGEKPLDDDYGMDDLAPETLAEMAADCAVFQRENGHLWKGKKTSRGGDGGVMDTQAGHDFWLTRNGHGAGFCDRPKIYGENEAEELTEACKNNECVLYVGDDNRLYVT